MNGARHILAQACPIIWPNRDDHVLHGPRIEAERRWSLHPHHGQALLPLSPATPGKIVATFKFAFFPEAKRESASRAMIYSDNKAEAP